MSDHFICFASIGFMTYSWWFRNPANQFDMDKLDNVPLFTGFYTSQSIRKISSINSILKQHHEMLSKVDVIPQSNSSKSLRAHQTGADLNHSYYNKLPLRNTQNTSRLETLEPLERGCWNVVVANHLQSCLDFVALLRITSGWVWEEGEVFLLDI